ncbi:hypothetical protein [Ornithinicoccus hortensis]|uniref:hypothetical protein n=1 Tax=Ornithinicoccus hortensis TaxID=82346 RepID=UPI00114F2F11|nr:hypothetical protein [Ornithinicoccus hortensis]
MTGSGGSRRGLVGALLASLLALGGCATGAPPTLTPAAPRDTTGAEGAPSQGGAPVRPPGPVPDPFVPAGDELTDEDLQAFGARLTDALESGDVEHWLSYFALDDEQTERQRQWFTAVQAVPMEVREMHPTLWLGPDGAEVGADGEWSSEERVRFGFRHQVSGADPVPSVELYDVGLERSEDDGGLRINDLAGDPDQGDYPQLWDVGPVEVLESDHLVVLTDPEQRELVRELLPSLDLAAAETLSEVPVDGVDRMVVTLTSAERVATLFGEGEVNELAGFAMPVTGIREVGQYDGLADLDPTDDLTVRLVLDLEYTADELDNYGEDVAGGSPLLRHEGMHLAMLLRHLEANPPKWVSEGFAGWFEVAAADEPAEDLEWWYGVLLKGAGLPTELPPSLWLAFEGEGPMDIDRNYAASAMVFRYVEETYGYETTVALGDRLHQIALWDDWDGAIDDALHEQLGTGSAEFVDGWTAWVADRYPDVGSGD